MDLGLRNKRALVTAASRGLGLASARALAAEGARVAMAARSTSSLTREAEALARSGKTETLPLTMDLCDPSSIGRGVDEVIRRWGGIDILITNTPGPIAGEFVTISRESWQAALNMVLWPVIDLLHRSKNGFQRFFREKRTSNNRRSMCPQARYRGCRRVHH